MEVILKVSVMFALALAVSFLIERFLEILKAVYDLLDSRFNWHTYWTRRTIKMRDRLEKRLEVFEYVNPKKIASLLDRFKKMFLNGQGGYSGTVPVLSGDLVRAVSIKVYAKIIGVSLGIGFAFWMNIDLISIWQKAAGGTSWWEINIESESVRFVLSGVILGLGSAPVHKIITTIEKKRQQKLEKGMQP